MLEKMTVENAVARKVIQLVKLVIVSNVERNATLPPIVMLHQKTQEVKVVRKVDGKVHLQKAKIGRMTPRIPKAVERKVCQFAENLATMRTMQEDGLPAGGVERRLRRVVSST